MLMMILKKLLLRLSLIVRSTIPIAIWSFFVLWLNKVLGICYWGRRPISTRFHTSFSISMDLFRLAHLAQLSYPISFSYLALEPVGFLSKVILI